jgi:alkanesulfonate monooxygenase SsuD/methylene tetrahydromethanopterin reductase-like flavin-dependent oxidoreductase (luciferase family)
MNSQQQLGFILSYDYLKPSLCHDLITLLDNTNFSHLFVPEIWGHDAFSQIASMTKYASNLTFGTGIVNLYSRTPATIAQTAASLHEMTEGKFVLGLGLSGPTVIQNWHGINYFQVSPLQRTREYFEILRLIFSGERVNYPNGKIYKLRGFKLMGFEPPLDIPLFLAALGPKNLALAGELADGWFPIWTSFTELPNLKRELAKGIEKRTAGISKDVEIAPFIITCASESPKAKLLVQKHLAYYVGGMGTFYFEFMKRFGFETEANRIRTAWQNGERETAAKNVSQNMLDRIAVLGSRDEVNERYKQLRQLGGTLPVVMLPYNCSPEFAIETIGALSE